MNDQERREKEDAIMRAAKQAHEHTVTIDHFRAMERLWRNNERLRAMLPHPDPTQVVCNGCQRRVFYLN